MMTRGVAYSILVAFAATSIALVAARPDWVGDQNSFLKAFVNHEYLNVLGVTLAITLASAAQIHLAFNRIEEHFNEPGGLASSRRDLRQNAFALIVLFVCAVTLVVVKPIASSNEVAQAFFNMAAMFILLWHVLLLLSLVQLVFAIPPFTRSKPPAQLPSPPSTAPTGIQPQPDTPEKKPQ